MRSTVFVWAVLVASCGSSGDSTPAAPDAGTTADTGTATDTGTSSAAVIATDKSASLTFELPPGVEKTVCVYVRLKNPEPMFITKAIGTLAPGSHHLIIYKATTAEENLTPQGCTPFAGLISGKEVMIGETAKPNGVTELPPNVGIKIDANQMIKLEAHYINATKSKLTAKGTWSFEGVPVASAGAMEQADAFLWGSTKITIPPKSAWDTGVKFQKGQAGTKVFFLTTHQHQFGTKMTLWSSKAANDTSLAPLVEETNWADPKMFQVNPALEMDGTSGISYKCEYNNTSAEEVKFGESALEEMCFAIGWYYPSKGVDVCFEGVCPGRK